MYFQLIKLLSSSKSQKLNLNLKADCTFYVENEFAIMKFKKNSEKVYS